MTKIVKMSITIEIENSQKMTAEFVIQSDHFEQRMREIQEQFDPFYINKVFEKLIGKI